MLVTADKNHHYYRLKGTISKDPTVPGRIIEKESISEFLQGVEGYLAINLAWPLKNS
jgi:hypothetical protein